MRFLVAIVLAGYALLANAIEADIHSLKAAYIYNFTKHISLPSSSSSEFHIAVVRNTETYQELVKLLKEKTIYDKPVTITLTTHLTTKESSADIIVCDQIKSPEEEIIKRSTALVITEHEDSNRQSIINFVVEGSKLRFEINLTRAKEKDIKISSRLLNLARVLE